MRGRVIAETWRPMAALFLVASGCNVPKVLSAGGTTGSQTSGSWTGTLTFSNVAGTSPPDLTSFVPSAGMVVDPDGGLAVAPTSQGDGTCSQTLTVDIPGASASTTYSVAGAGSDGGVAVVTYQETCGQSAPGEWTGVGGSITVNAVTSASADLTFSAVQMLGAGDGGFQIDGEISGSPTL